MKLDVEIRGEKDAGRKLDALGERATDASDAFHKILDKLIEGEKSLFRRSGGKKWAPLARSTTYTKKSRGQDPRMMRASGALERSLTQIGAPHQIKDINGESLTFGTSLFYAHFHQKPRRNEPKREVLQFRPIDKRHAREVLLDHLLGLGEK